MKCPECGKIMKEMSTLERPNLYIHTRSNKKCRVQAVQLNDKGEVWRVFYWEFDDETM